ncbi:MAG TPA: helix-turn-helix domain-containing protein [Chitinophagaceae bacterium]|nr:helix-turn-helix domain-containing protein [Chitinophagaceae bacterium]
MIQLGILLTKQHRLLSVAAILDVFETVNKFYEDAGKQPFFTIALFTADSETLPVYAKYTTQQLSQATTQHLVIVPAFGTTDIKTALQQNAAAMPWLARQYSSGAEIASVCTGAFLIAAAGLLNNKMATTHANSAAAFFAAFPLVNLHADAVVTDDKGIYTSGGSTSSFHLMIHLLQKYCGRDVAIRTAKYFSIDMDRKHQTYFSTFQPVHAHNDELVAVLQQRIQKDYADVKTIEELLNDIPASRRNLVRRFKQATGNTPIDYLQKTRIEAAKKVLEQPGGNITASMVASGYNDLKTFRLLFKKNVGITPSAYRSKYNGAEREAV